MPNTKEGDGAKLKSSVSGGAPIEMGGESISSPSETPTAPVEKVPEPEVVTKESEPKEKGESSGVIAFVVGLIIGALITSIFL